MELVILNGMKAIKSKFGVRSCTVKQWVKTGAPIVVRNAGNGTRYLCDPAKLYEWLLKNSQTAKTSQGFQE